jgi:nucleotide-binding universal stress UspA family protein
MLRTILVATDGTPAAMGALRLAKGLAEVRGYQILVLAVVEPVPVFDAGFMVALPEADFYETRQIALRDEVSGQVEMVWGSRAGCPIAIKVGLPGPRIMAHAEEVGADMVLMGLGRHGPLDRVFGTETALQVVRLSHLPVLAVPSSTSRLPTSAVLAVDFSLFSHRAAQAAIDLLAVPWEIHLVHVLSGMEFLPTLSEEWRGDYESELLERLADFADDLGSPPGCRSQVHVLEGEPSHELLAFAQSKRAELLVAGSHGHSFVGRLLMGSVSTRLIRSAQVPVLVVPPSERSEEILSEVRPGEPQKRWASELTEFTRNNAGRRTTLEIDQPGVGRQECGRDFPLWGVDYDPRRDRLEIMLGRSGTVEGHLTHSLPAPQEVRIERGEDGLARALHIGFRTGTAILKIHRD